MTSYTFRVPEQHREFLARLARLHESQFIALRTAFEKSSATFVPPHDLAIIAKKAEGWDTEDSETLVSVLFAMLAAMLSHSVTPDEFAHNLSLSEDLPIQNDERDRLRRRLVHLLTAPLVEASGKASIIATDNERNFHTARVITEVRPIFRHDPTLPPLGGVVLHQLHLDAWTGEDSQTYVVTLDPSDLELLKQVIDRALAKGESLETWLQGVGFNSYHLDPSEGTYDGSH